MTPEDRIMALLEQRSRELQAIRERCRRREQRVEARYAPLLARELGLIKPKPSAKRRRLKKALEKARGDV